MELSVRSTQPIIAAGLENRPFRKRRWGGDSDVNEKVTDANNTEPEEVQATICTESTEVSETQL
jgi:hypothetical protein